MICALVDLERSLKSATENRMKTIVTHNAKFHADDVFAVATLFLVFGKENCEVIRTRDESLVSKADIVVDVGMEYNEDNLRFDHHQKEGAGDRENKIPYASFGLVWKKYGADLCGSKVAADILDRDIVQPIDAADNGVDLFNLNELGVRPFLMHDVLNSYHATWKEEDDWDRRFLLAVDFAMSVLSRRIEYTKALVEAEIIIDDTYNKTLDKRIVVIDEKYDFGRELVNRVLSKYSEPLYGVLYRHDYKNWQVVAMRNGNGFSLKKPLPGNWLAKRDLELAESCGVKDAIFCHRGGFMCVVETKEGAIALATKALEG